MGRHPTVGRNVTIYEGFDVAITGLCSTLWVLNPLDQQFFTGSPAIGNARKARGSKHFVGYLVARGAVRIEQGLTRFNVAFVPNTRGRGQGRQHYACRKEGFGGFESR